MQVKIIHFNHTGRCLASCCRYHKSLVGRDYKLWAQVGLFIVWDFLQPPEQDVWISLAKASQLTSQL